MSVRLMGIVWDMDLPLGEKMVLLKLADRANDDGECWPGQESLAKQCSMTDRALRDNLAKIKERGLVEVEMRRKGNRQATNLYRLTLQPEDTSASKHEKTPSQPEVSSASKQVSAGSLRQFQPEVCDIAYKEEPSVEPPVVVTSVTTPPRVASKLESPEDRKIEFDPVDQIFVNISAEQMAQWEDAYRGLDVDAELTRAEAWYAANPRKRKKNHQRFLVNWLARAHDRLKIPPSRPKPRSPERSPAP